MIEYFAFYRQILLLSHAGRGGVVQLFQFGNGILYVAQQHVCHVAAESLTDNDTHHNIFLQFGSQRI